jgi:hypothetical protein
MKSAAREGDSAAGRAPVLPSTVLLSTVLLSSGTLLTDMPERLDAATDSPAAAHVG